MEPQKNVVSIHSIVNHNKTATEPPETCTADILLCSSVCRYLMRSTNITDAACPPRMEAAFCIDPSGTKQRGKKENSDLEVPWAARL